jgi:hypothetical protein
VFENRDRDSLSERLVDIVLRCVRCVQVGRTALHIAALNGVVDLCEFLILNGSCADVETNVRCCVA